jgi:hypothetical protein
VLNIRNLCCTIEVALEIRPITFRKHAMKFRMILAAVLFISCTGGAFAQPVLSVSIHIPKVTVDQATESYDPMPIPVTVTIYNTGNAASQTLSARIALTPDLALDGSEQGAVIKGTLPVTVQPNDSAKVEWKLTHPPSFSPINHRVRVWLKHTPVDSFETQKLFILPAMDRPDFGMTLVQLPRLLVRPDSLGYDQNPFQVFLRLTNQGGTTMDSVTTQLFLPQDYILDPSTQANPQVYGLPIPPPQAGNPRIEMTWNVRYVGATRQFRTDTLRLRATGKDRAGGLVQKDTTMLIEVDGLSPRYSISFLDAGVMQYDTAKIYSPQPYPLIVRIENPSEQWIDLGTLALSLQGEGIATQDALTHTLPLLLAGSHIDFQWHITAERRSQPRQFVAIVEVADAGGRLQSGTHTVSIPGQPYALTVQEFEPVDTLAVNTEGTAFLTDAIPLSFRFRNDAWYNSTVTASRVQSQGTDILPPPFRDKAHAFFLTPAEMSPAVLDTFRVQGQIDPRFVTFHVTAVSNREDTARASRSVYIPGLLPVARLTHRGPAHILPDYLGGYAPSPMAQEYVLSNDGSINFRVDSVVLRYPMDGVITPEPLRLDYGTTLPPGDSLSLRWNFALYPRDTIRIVPMHVTAYLSGRFDVDISNTVLIDPLVPGLAAQVSGPDSLAFDAATLYSPNPFTKTLRIRNSGTAELHLDSVALLFTDALITPLDPLIWSNGRVLKPDSVLALSWRLLAARHEEATTVPLTFAVHHSGGTRSDVPSSVFLPALVPGLDASIHGDVKLVYDPDNVYWPDPFTKTVRVRNSGTADLLLDSIVVSWTDPLVQSMEAVRRDLLQDIPPGAETEETWRFRTAAHASAGYVTLRFTLYHGGGKPLPLATDIHVPGEPFAFRITDMQLPDRIEPRSDGQGYEGNPVVTLFTIENDAWFSTSLRSARVELRGDGVQMLTPQPRSDVLLFNPGDRSSVLRDSFFVLPASLDRIVQVTVSVESDRGLIDSETMDMFVPRIGTNAAGDSPTALRFTLHGLYPNPLRAGVRQPLRIDVEGNGSLRAEIYDRLGRFIWRDEDIDAPGARGSVALWIPPLSEGMYLLRIESGGMQTARPFVVLR